ncbi:hypothetical protein AZI87_13455 [Bdellovibrio bacteriovorus]|uniref:Uncharacterized protein n=1 Tax=Bdellovibrio bacteriovorus TaxID=959 RepID=A0A161PB25_BDEBC|nr:hypothetical protein [Bdellovibrio bacteriovorus]KYG64242.1 hypothetical protein AZI87_13455 [Bdellovibrio bacteriovorus]
MKIKSKILTLALLGILGAVTFAAKPAKADILPLPTANLSNRSVWITVYSLVTHQQLDWGCLPARSQRTWWSGNYVVLVPYYVRGEVKENADCSGRTIGDNGTQIQLPSYAWIDQSFNWHTTPTPPMSHEADPQYMDAE